MFMNFLYHTSVNDALTGFYCDMRERIKGAVHTFLSRIVVRVQYGQY